MNVIPINDTLKYCSTCDSFKPLADFTKDSHRKDGYNNKCKVCRNAYKRAWNAKNRVKESEYQKRSYSKHRTKRIEYIKNYNKTHRERVNANNRKSQKKRRRSGNYRAVHKRIG